MQHPNQFLICGTSYEPRVPDGFCHSEFTDQADIYHSNLLPFDMVSKGGTTITIIGDAVLPGSTTIEDWLQKRAPDDFEDFLRESQNLTGRYIILYSDEDSTTAIPDPISHKAIYYHSKYNLISSSLKLLTDSLDLSLSENETVRSFTNSEGFRKNEAAFVGDKTQFNEVKRLLPNHLLEMHEMCISRRPLYPPQPQQAPSNYVAKVMTAAIKSFNENYNLIAGLTAGMDFRTILACSRDIADDISWFTFSFHPGNSPDIQLAKELATDHDLSYSIHHSRTLDDEFLTEYREFLRSPRELPKTRNIQFHYYNSNIETDLYLTGNGGEIIRSYYDRLEKDAENVEYACDALHYPDSDFVKAEIDDWWLAAKEYAKKYNIPIMDLLYWEHRMGRWGARMPLERDIAIRGVSPFSNYNLLLSGLSTKRAQRSAPDYELMHDVIDSKWPALNEYEYNPATDSLKSSIYNATPYPLDHLLKSLYNSAKNVQS